MNASEKMVEMFELVGELMSVPGLDDVVEEYNKVPETKRIAKNGLRLKVCALCVKHAPDTMQKLACLELDKSEQEFSEMGDKEKTAVFQQIVSGVVTPFLS